MAEEYYLTESGAEKMRIELEDMKTRQRDELALRLRTAIQQGDLSENADYHKAKEDQAFLEGKIQEYEEIVAGVVIIEEKHSEIIEIGSHVTLEIGGSEERFHLVGAQEANPREGRISNESPIGRAIIGHKAGEMINAKTPGGKLKIKIVVVE